MYHLTQNLGLTYTLRVLKDDAAVFEYQPFENPRVLERAEYLDIVKEERAAVGCTEVMAVAAAG